MPAVGIKGLLGILVVVIIIAGHYGGDLGAAHVGTDLRGIFGFIGQVWHWIGVVFNALTAKHGAS